MSISMARLASGSPSTSFASDIRSHARIWSLSRCISHTSYFQTAAEGEHFHCTHGSYRHGMQ